MADATSIQKKVFCLLFFIIFREAEKATVDFRPLTRTRSKGEGSGKKGNQANKQIGNINKPGSARF